MTAAVEDFGETIVTEENVADWVEMVKAGRAATRAFQYKRNTFDRMRPIYGSDHASSESGEE